MSIFKNKTMIYIYLNTTILSTNIVSYYFMDLTKSP